MVNMALAAITLIIIIVAGLTGISLTKRIFIFLGLGAFCSIFLTAIGHGDVVYAEYMVNYVQFIPIPLLSVLMAALMLFEVNFYGKGREIGWFLLIACPIAGNFATTWSLVPIGLSLYFIVKKLYPDRWLPILVTVGIFSKNMLALATLLADPPQCIMAIMEKQRGNNLDFFYTLRQFWPYILMTWVVYGLTLKRLGVEFGSFTRLKDIVPESWGRVALGMGIVAAMGFALLRLQGYEVPVFLGVVLLAVVALSFWKFGKHQRHEALEWGVETASLFIAFFAVVCFAHVGLHEVHLPSWAMIPAVIGMTAFADNAAAFLMAYPTYVDQSADFQNWFNLFNAVNYGGSTPLGNGPQITLLLVILCNKKIVTQGQIWKVWMSEVWVVFPYLLVWTVLMAILIGKGYAPTPLAQFVVGLGALGAWGLASAIKFLPAITGSVKGDPELTVER